MGGITFIGVPAVWPFVALMVGVVVLDMRQMRIPHWLLAALIGLFLFSVPFAVPLQELLWRSLAAVVVFALCLAAFAAHRLGGGDTKLLPLVILFVPSGALALFALFLSAGILVGLIAVRSLRRLPVAATQGWAGISKADRFPLGPGIGLAAIGFFLFGAQVAALI